MNVDSIIVKKYKIVNKIVTNKFLNKFPLKLKKLILLYDYKKEVECDYMSKLNFTQTMLDLYSIINSKHGRSHRLITKDYPDINISTLGTTIINIYSDNIFSIQLIWEGEESFKYDYYDSGRNRYTGRYDNTVEKEVGTFYEEQVKETLVYIFYHLFKEYYLEINK